jgi:hypothetical protein
MMALLLPLLWIVGIVSWLCGVVFMFKAAGHARRLQNAPSFVRWNPFNILVRPDLWTPELRSSCHVVFASLAVFVSAILASFLIAFLVGIPIRG